MYNIYVYSLYIYIYISHYYPPVVYTRIIIPFGAGTYWVMSKLLST